VLVDATQSVAGIVEKLDGHAVGDRWINVYRQVNVLPLTLRMHGRGCLDRAQRVAVDEDLKLWVVAVIAVSRHAQNQRRARSAGTGARPAATRAGGGRAMQIDGIGAVW